MPKKSLNIKFTRDPHDPDFYTVDVAYRKKDIDHGDILEWTPTGDVPAGAVVSVGNFQLKAGSPGLLKYKNGTVTPVLQPPPKADPNGLSLDTARFELGHYKYDILVDGQVVMDPDLEIRGPKN